MNHSGPHIDFIDLKSQRARLEPALSTALKAVIESGIYIGGPKVRELEHRLREVCGARHCISCANGTDALMLVLKGWEIGPGDAVFVPAFSFIATASVVVNLGATPVFVDARADTFNMDPSSLAEAVAWSRSRGLRPRAVIPVDLFGRPADYEVIAAIAAGEQLLVLCDAAQSFGATVEGRAVGTFGDASATSFYPSKPLGCYGDGGAIFTDDDSLAARLRSVRDHGQGSHRYEHVHVGVNSRLDALQAAVLLAKVEVFSDELRLRQEVAQRYSRGLGDLLDVPVLPDNVNSTWAQYTLRTEHRDALAELCRANGIPTAIHYPLPLSKQPAYRAFATAPGGVPVSERLASTVISLPMHPYLDRATQDFIISTVRSAIPRQARMAGGF